MAGKYILKNKAVSVYFFSENIFYYGGQIIFKGIWKFRFSFGKVKVRRVLRWKTNTNFHFAKWEKISTLKQTELVSCLFVHLLWSYMIFELLFAVCYYGEEILEVEETGEEIREANWNPPCWQKFIAEWDTAPDDSLWTCIVHHCWKLLPCYWSFGS